MPSMPPSLLPLILAIRYGATFAAAYSFEFANTPVQCGELDLKITGDGGKPPYTALFFPFSSSPLPKEVRRVVNAKFNDTSSLKIPSFPYPSNSQFVVVVSDSTGFGTGGVSAAATIGKSDDSSCYDSNGPPPLAFSLQVQPDTPIQCNNTRLWWDPSKTQGNPTYQAVIPGGNAFEIIPNNKGNGRIDDQSVNGFGTGFNWLVNIQAQTQIILTAFDTRGYVAGSNPYTIQPGPFPSTECLTDSKFGASPSSTAGDPAGGSYPTSSASGSSPTNSSSGGGSSNKKTNIGAIVGGVVGGVVGLLALLLLGLFFMRRRRFHRQQKERPVDLLNDGDDPRDDNLPQYYRPDPFVLPDPSAADHHSMREGEGAGLLAAGAAGSEGRRSHESQGTASTRPPVMQAALSAGRPSSDRRSSTHLSSAGGRKGAAPTPLRPVNFIVHDDGGRVPDADKGVEDAEETIELPPAYTNIKRGPSTRIPHEEQSDAGHSTVASQSPGAGPSSSAVPPPAASPPLMGAA